MGLVRRARSSAPGAQDAFCMHMQAPSFEQRTLTQTTETGLTCLQVATEAHTNGQTRQHREHQH